MFYNSKAIQEAGVSAPPTTWTWDDFATYAGKVSKALSSKQIYGTSEATGAMDMFEIWVRTNGHDLYTTDGQAGFTQDDVQTWFEYWSAMRMAGSCAPAQLQATDTSAGPATALISKGKTAFATAHSNQFSGFQTLVTDPLKLQFVPTGKQTGNYLKCSMMMSIAANSKNYDLLSAPKWLGAQNYQNMFRDPQWLDAARVTLTYVFLSVPLKLAFALLVALMLKQGLQALGLYRAIYYIPSLLGGSVAIALLWQQIFSENGIVNQALGLIGIHSTTSWISTPGTALSTLVILSVWQFGAPMLIFLAGLKQIPPEYYEAASTDGAGIFRKFFSITLPMITPILFFNLILQIVGAFQAFTPAYIVSGGNGGPRADHGVSSDLDDQCIIQTRGRHLFQSWPVLTAMDIAELH